MSKKHLLVIAGSLVILLIAALFWQWSGSAVTGRVQQWLVDTASRSLNGTLRIATMDFSFSGSLVARQVELLDASGNKIFASEIVAVDFDLSDLFGRRFDLERVRKIRIEKGLLHLVQNDEKQWNAVQVLKTDAKPASSQPQPTFRGKLEVVNSNISVKTVQSQYRFNNLTGQLDFAKYPDIAVDLRSKDGAATLSAKGSWNFSGGGNIDVVADSADPATYMSAFPLKGATSLQAKVSGTTAKPVASGSYKIAAGSLGDLSFREASGKFRFADSLLYLTETTAQALGGSIQVSGTVDPSSLRYVQTVSGQNIDVKQLSDRDMQGRVNFNSEVRGQGSWDGASADGTFNMGTGSISGIAFDSLTGNFSKRGAATRYFNLVARIAGQTIRIGDADSLSNLANLFTQPSNIGLPGLPKLPATPTTPQAPRLPVVPSLPRLPGLSR